jgi:hypothetical protein
MTFITSKHLAGMDRAIHLSNEVQRLREDHSLISLMALADENYIVPRKELQRSINKLRSTAAWLRFKCRDQWHILN